MSPRPHLDEASLAALSRPRFDRWALAAAVDWGVIVATFALAAQLDHPLAYALAVVPIGSRQQALGALFHDAAHRLASRSRSLNDMAGNLLAAWPLGLSLGGYRRYHFAHHRSLGTDRDPENAHKQALPQWRLPAEPPRVALHFVGDLLGGGLPHLAAAGKLTRPVSVLEAAGLGLFWVVVLLVAYRLDALWVPLLWLASIATVFWSGVRLRIWTEHLGTRGTHRIRVPAWFSQFIMPHDIGLHWEHHHWPTVPFWNLSRLRNLLPPGEAGAPALLSLGDLWRAFLSSTPLPSGQAGATVNVEPPPRPVITPARPVAWRYLLHVALPFAAGVLVYLLCRRTPPRPLAWLPTGLLAGRLPRGFVDVFPDATWAYSLTALQSLVWSGAPGRSRWLWVASAPLLVAAWELGQYARLLPGTFDPADLAFGVAACLLAVLFCSAMPGASAPREKGL